MNDLIQILASASGAAILAAIINAVVNRRKLSAEATEIITKASAGVVENIMADNKIVREELVKLRAELELLRQAQIQADVRERAHALTEERYRHHLERWHRYSLRQSEAIKSLGGVVEDPPPMWPDPVMPADLRH